MRELARRYAAALYAIHSQEQGLEEAVKSIEENPSLWTVLCNPLVPFPEKHQVIAVACGEAPPAILSFLKLLCDNDHIKELPTIAAEYHQLCLTAADVLPAVLWYASPPEVETIETIKEKLKQTFGKSGVELTLRENLGLLGGFVVEAAGKRFDRSIRGALDGLEIRLMEKLPEPLERPRERHRKGLF